jgi:3D (Asp-Asp-Asp) domain-containing protein
MNVKHFSVIIFSLFLLNFVFAAPGMPHQFYGNVTINGVPANNASIVAKIGVIEYGNGISVDGKYGFNPGLFFVEDPNSNNAGKKIEFFVNATKVAEATFINAGYTNLNLALGVAPFCGDGICNNAEDYTSCPSDCAAPSNPDTGSPGGSPGGGGGSGGLNVTFSEKCINQDVEIQVTLSNKKPATNANVKVYSGSKVVVEGKTNDEGIFSFNLAEIKEYKLDVRKPGYLAKKIDFSLVDCSTQEEIEITSEDITEETLGTESVLTCDKINCDDLNPCTQDSCNNSVCSYTQLSSIPCGEKGSCNAGTCVEPKPVVLGKQPVASTGFLGLSGIQEQLAMGLGILIIAGILFVAYQKFK